VDHPCKPEGSNWVVPYLWVKDVDAVLVEYQAAFGFEPGERIAGSTGRTAHAEMRYQGKTVIMLGAEGLAGTGLRPPAETGRAAPVGLYVYCEDVDALAQAALEQNMVLTEPVRDAFWGERIVNLRCNNGYAWTFASQS